MDRRTFMGVTASLSFAGTSWGAATSAYRGRRLLVLLLRGGMDGLSAIPPIGDPQLNAIRGNLVPQDLLPGNSFFGIHPALPTFSRLMAKGEAVAVQASGFAYVGRSHFEGQDVMQSGVMKPYASLSGWLGRAMEKAQLGAGVALSIPMPLLLRGDGVSDTKFPTWMQAPSGSTYSVIGDMWSKDASLAPYRSVLAAVVKETSGGMGGGGNSQQRTSPAGLAREAAQSMRRADGPMVGLIDFDGFDTHAMQGAGQGTHADKLKLIEEVTASFETAMGPMWKDTLVLTITEFGRTAAENGTSGTDHGWGSCILAAGGLVKTAGVVADWPGLAKPKLFEERDLAVTVDAAAVYANAIQSVFGLEPAQIQNGVLAHKPHPLAASLFRV